MTLLLIFWSCIVGSIFAFSLVKVLLELTLTDTHDMGFQTADFIDFVPKGMIYTKKEDQNTPFRN